MWGWFCDLQGEVCCAQRAGCDIVGDIQFTMRLAATWWATTSSHSLHLNSKHRAVIFRQQLATTMQCTVCEFSNTQRPTHPPHIATAHTSPHMPPHGDTWKSMWPHTFFKWCVGVDPQLGSLQYTLIRQYGHIQTQARSPPARKHTRTLFSAPPTFEIHALRPKRSTNTGGTSFSSPPAVKTVEVLRVWKSCGL